MPGRGQSGSRSSRSSGSRCHTTTCGSPGPSRSVGVTRYQPLATNAGCAPRATSRTLTPAVSANTRCTRAELRSSHARRRGQYRKRPPRSRAPGYTGITAAPRRTRAMRCTVAIATRQRIAATIQSIRRGTGIGDGPASTNEMLDETTASTNQFDQCLYNASASAFVRWALRKA